jgi:integrase/recombinase XerC
MMAHGFLVKAVSITQPDAHFCTVLALSGVENMARKPAPWFRRSTGEYYVTINGKQTPLGITDPSDIMGAWSALQKLLENQAFKKPAVRSESLSALLPDYLASLEARAKPKTIKDYGATLKSFLARFGGCASEEIDPATVELHASKQGWSDSYRNNWLWGIQAFIRWTGRKDFTMRRPAKESRGAESVITEETQRLILRETKGDFHELCRFLYATGCRPMEAARLTVDMIDWKSGTASFKQHKTSYTGRKRILYLSTDALLILKGQSDRYGGKGNLFRGMRGKPFTIQAIVTRMIRISEKIGRPVSSYGYRHGFCTRALTAGIPETHVAAMMGHTSTAMINRHYNHVSANATLLRDAANKVG